MELRHLRYFVILAEELNFTRAAKRLRIAQPGLSNQIRALEDELGVQLLIRTNKEVVLSQSGRLLLARARALLDQADDIERLMKRNGRGEMGDFVIGYVPALLNRVQSWLARDLRQRHPKMNLELRDMSALEQLHALREGKIDVGVLPQFSLLDAPWINTFVFESEPMIAALPSKHRLARRQTVAWRDLAGEPLIFAAPEIYPAFWEVFSSACRKNGFEPKPAHYVNEMGARLRMVASGAGWTAAGQATALTSPRGIAFRKLDPPGPLICYALIWRKNHESVFLTSLLKIAKKPAS